MKKRIIIILVFLVLIIVAPFLIGSVLFPQNSLINTDNGAMAPTNAINPDAAISELSTSTAGNPASANCEKEGGRVQIETKEDGSQYGLCYFNDARACEEWSMLRGECPVGGRKTTGFDTIDQKYCAWNGGNTFAVENSVCTFPSGKTCSTKNFYSGICTK